MQPDETPPVSTSTPTRRTIALAVAGVLLTTLLLGVAVRLVLGGAESSPVAIASGPSTLPTLASPTTDPTTLASAPASASAAVSTPSPTPAASAKPASKATFPLKGSGYDVGPLSGAEVGMVPDLTADCTCLSHGTTAQS